MNSIIECVPNYSEGRDLDKVEKIVQCFRGKQGVKLLDYSSDQDYNRSVVTVVGEPEAVQEALLESIEKAIELIDMNKQKGQHPRMGAVDVIPFIPVKNIDIKETTKIANDFGKKVAEKFNYPVYLYEKSAAETYRSDLSKVRKGEYEGLNKKMQDSKWKPDFGKDKPHPTAGAVAIGAREFLIAWNINLDTSNLEIADKIAKKIRNLSGGMKFCKAIGIEIKEKNIVQVSINMTNFKKTSLYSVFELVKIEARRYGVNVTGSEVVGMMPLGALVDTVEYYLGLEGFGIDQVLEYKLLEE
jgi:glutamate formiminotransferase